MRGNVVDLAVGVVIGAAFSAIVNALVSDLLAPFITAVAKLPDFSSWPFMVNGSKFAIGHLMNTVISFILTAAAVFFFIVKPMNILENRARSHKEPPPPSTKRCTECLSEIPIAAKRCAHCTQPQP